MANKKLKYYAKCGGFDHCNAEVFRLAGYRLDPGNWALPEDLSEAEGVEFTNGGIVLLGKEGFTAANVASVEAPGCRGQNLQLSSRPVSPGPVSR